MIIMSFVQIVDIDTNFVLSYFHNKVTNKNKQTNKINAVSEIVKKEKKIKFQND